MTNRQRRQKQAAGFTLIELMVVVGIMGILAGAAAMNVVTSMKRASMNTLQYDLRVMRDVVQAYKADKKKFPESLQTLVDEGYLRSIPEDPITRSSDTWIELYAEDIEAVGDGLDLAMDFGTSSGFLDSGGLDVDSEDDGIRDVMSGASGSDLDGVPYSDY